MNALSNAQKQLNYRKRKEANAFSADYMNGVNVATPKVFIKSMETQHDYVHNTAGAVFNRSLTSAFYEHLKECPQEGGKYIIDDMLECWKLAELEVQ